MGTVIEDSYGHRQPAGAAGANLTAGAVSTTAVGTVAPTTAAGASPTVTFTGTQVANDTRGTFTLSPVTGGGAQSAGATAVVTFANPYGAAPGAVQVIVTNNAGPVAVPAYATSVTAAGFSITTGVLTTANVYTVSYQIIP